MTIVNTYHATCRDQVMYIWKRACMHICLLNEHFWVIFCPTCFALYILNSPKHKYVYIYVAFTLLIKIRSFDLFTMTKFKIYMWNKYSGINFFTYNSVGQAETSKSFLREVHMPIYMCEQ